MRCCCLEFGNSLNLLPFGILQAQRGACGERRLLRPPAAEGTDGLSSTAWSSTGEAQHRPLCSRQGQFEVTLALLRAGSQGGGPEVQRPRKALDSPGKLDGAFWPSTKLPLHRSLTRNAPRLRAAIKGSSGGGEKKSKTQPLTVSSSSVART